MLETAVKKQLEATDNQEFLSTLNDVTRGGADGGFHGFIYYYETTKFFDRNRKAIIARLEEDADNMGEPDIFSMMKHFRCLKDFTVGEIAAVLYGKLKDEDVSTQIKNCLAWYALEAVAWDHDR